MVPAQAEAVIAPVPEAGATAPRAVDIIPAVTQEGQDGANHIRRPLLEDGQEVDPQIGIGG